MATAKGGRAEPGRGVREFLGDELVAEGRIELPT
jgi:hypothetical protein